MIYLVIGLVTWSIFHFVPVFFTSIRASLITRIGEMVYKAIYSLIIVLSLVLIVIGWSSSEFYSMYSSFEYGQPIAWGMLSVAFVFFAASKLPTNIHRIIRHPQLTAVILWAIAHLLTSGDLRAIVLFGGLGVWALLEMVLINKRVGPWVKPAPISIMKDLLCIIIGLILFTVVVFLHPYLSDIPLL